MLAATSTERTVAPSGAGRVLLAAWLLAVVASFLGHHQGTGTGLVTGFLLWRIWHGALWSRWILMTLSALAGVVTVAIGLALAVGATGIVASTALAMLMYLAVGVLLCLPSVRGLARH